MIIKERLIIWGAKTIK